MFAKIDMEEAVRNLVEWYEDNIAEVYGVNAVDLSEELQDKIDNLKEAIGASENSKIGEEI